MVRCDIGSATSKQREPVRRGSGGRGAAEEAWRQTDGNNVVPERRQVDGKVLLVASGQAPAPPWLLRVQTLNKLFAGVFALALHPCASRSSPLLFSNIMWLISYLTEVSFGVCVLKFQTSFS